MWETEEKFIAMQRHLFEDIWVPALKEAVLNEIWKTMKKDIDHCVSEAFKRHVTDSNAKLADALSTLTKLLIERSI